MKWPSAMSWFFSCLWECVYEIVCNALKGGMHWSSIPNDIVLCVEYRRVAVCFGRD